MHGRRAATGAVLGAVAALLAADLRLPAGLSLRVPGALTTLAAVAVFALLALTRLRVLLSVAVGLVAALWLAVAFTPLTRALAGGLTRRDPPAPADAVVVLASSVQDDGELSAAGTSRLLRAIELLRAGLAPRLVVTEIAGRPSQLAAVRGHLEALGVAPELLVAGVAGDTHTEAVAAGRLLGGRGLRRVLLVTSPLHTRRAAAAFEHEGLEVLAVPAAETRYDVEGLADLDDRLRAFGDVVHERLGLAVYRWRGWLR